MRRAYYYCGRCHQSFLPYDEALGLVDEVSPGLMPLVCLAGTEMKGIGASQAEHRMLYTALLYTPDKGHSRYLVDFELDALAEQVRSRSLGVVRVSDLIAITDGGNGLEEALRRHLAEDVTTILDWYHAAEHLCDFAKVWHARDEAARTQWQTQAKDVLYDQGGEALLTYLQALALPAEASAGAGGVASADRLL